MAIDQDAIDEAIQTNLLGPHEMASDQGSMRTHPLPDQIKAKNLLAANQAAKNISLGLWFRKFVPPGSV